MKRRTSGFTVTELLISMLIMGVVTTAVAGLTQTFLRGSDTLITRSELLNDTVHAQSILTSRVHAAYSVLPPGTRLNLAGAGATAVTPSTGSALWTVGTDPLLALLLPPDTGDGAACTGAALPLCPSLVVLYAAKRSVVVGNAPASDNPGSEVINDDTTWTLMQYRGYFLGGMPSPLPTTPALTGSTTRLLADHLQPDGGGRTLFTFDAVAGTVSDVTVSLKTQARSGTQTIMLPGQGSYSLNLAPRNAP